VQPTTQPTVPPITQPTTQPITQPTTQPTVPPTLPPTLEAASDSNAEPLAEEPVTFESYVATRGPALIRFASRLTGSQHRAEDLVQDALAKAYQRWDSIQRKDQPDVYLRRMLVNAARSWWRPRSNRELPVETPLGDRAEDRADDRDVGKESAERDEMWRLIGSLPPRQRAVLVLRYYEDLDDNTIAVILDCSPVTVRTHAMRALDVLRTHFDIDTERANERANDGANS
jgi:RNA polymerase sigma-70 factor (sigma-E family)